MLEREDKLRQEAKAEMAEMEARMEANMKKMRDDLTPAQPAEAISAQQVTALQARLEALHATKLLGDDELYALEDMVADFVEYESSLGVVILDSIFANENASKLHKLVALSERIVVDGAFARQVRRKYV
jgi:uncharacterized protein YqiB (DUF1249 family)